MNNLYYMNAHSFAKMEANVNKAQEGYNLGDFVNQRQAMTMDNEKIATIDIRGALIDDAPKIYSDLGNTNYRDVIAEIAAAQEQGARGIIYTIDSPGGTVAGCEEAAKAAEAVGVPSVTYYHGLGCSAAYKFGCSAMAIVATPSAEVGNIGTILTYADYSKFEERMGIEVHALTNDGAELKSIFHKMPLSDEQTAFLQDSINDAGELFQNHVLSNRPDIDQEVFKAGWYKGEKAVELGLVDQIGTLEDAKNIIRATMPA